MHFISICLFTHTGKFSLDDFVSAFGEFFRVVTGPYKSAQSLTHSWSMYFFLKSLK